MKSALTLTNASVDRGGRRVVDAVTLNIEGSGWFGLIGANGSGKTTLLRAISGRLPLAGGSVLLGTRELAHQRAGRARMIGFAPPAEALPQALRVCEALALVGGSADEAVSNIGGLRMALGIDGLMEKSIGACSAGMKQRVAIACAFASGKEIVILDEPFNWLDPVAAFDVKQVLAKMVGNGLTLITALHDLSTLTQLCDAGAIMSDGQIVVSLDGADLREAAQNLADFEGRMIELLRSPA